VQGGYGTCFCRHGTNFIEHYECRGTRLIGAANLSPVTKLIAGTGAVSRYKLSRSKKFITVQDLYCVQMRVSGCNGHYEFVLGAGAKAKTVTNNLPILSVLCAALVYLIEFEIVKRALFSHFSALEINKSRNLH
jgi:hypothetical protein